MAPRFCRMVFLRSCTACLVLVLTPLTAAYAQDPAALPGLDSGRIIGRVWHTNVRTQNAFEYLQKVRGELKVPESPVMMLGGVSRMGMGVGLGGPGLRARGNEPSEMSGTLYVLQTLPEVSFNKPISFEKCESLERFTQLVTEQKNQMGPATELIGGDDRYEVKLSLEPRVFQAPAADGKNPTEKSETRVLSIVVASDLGTPGAAGKAPEIPKSISTYYRYVDGILYSSASNALYTMTLPSQEGLKLDDETSVQDVYADFDLTQIPSDFRTAFWNALESQASVFLQRFDNEAEGQYSLRRVIAEGRLELLKRAMFDVERVRFAMKLSSASGQPVVSQLRIQARENSTLASFLSVVSNQGTQLTGLQDEQSPLVLSTTVVIPEFVRPFAGALIASAGLYLNHATDETPAAGVLVTDLVSALQETVNSGVLDATVCLRGTVETGLIPCGAIRIESADKLLDAMEFLLQVTSLKDYVALTHETVGDYRMVSVRTENACIPLTNSVIPAQLNLTATGSWLWITIGDQRAVDMLQQIVADSEESLSRTGIGAPLLVRMKLSKWLGNTDDSLSRVPSQWLETAERWLQKTTAPKMSISLNGANLQTDASSGGEFKSYAAAALTPEDSDVEFRIRSAEKEILVDARVGTGLAKFAVAQFLDSQSRMFKGFSMPITIGGPGGKAGTLKMEGTGGNAGQSGQFRIQIGDPNPPAPK
jgi:hypothetical protein